MARNGSNVEVKDSNGITCLHYACQSGHADVVAYLLKEGATKTRSFAATGNKALLESRVHDGITPLHLACQEGHVDVAGVRLSERVVGPHSPPPHAIIARRTTHPRRFAHP